MPSATRPSLQRPTPTPADLPNSGRGRAQATSRPMTTCVTHYSIVMPTAEEEGFEPPELALGGFQDRCLQPLGHSSRTSPEAVRQYRDRRSLVKYDRETSTSRVPSRGWREDQTTTPAAPTATSVLRCVRARLRTGAAPREPRPSHRIAGTARGSPPASGRSPGRIR